MFLPSPSAALESGTPTSAMFTIPGTGRSVNSLQLTIADPSEISLPLFINVTNVHLINGTRMTFMYSTTSLPANGTICVGDLTLGTAYNICVSTRQAESEVCRQESTAASGTAVEGCLFPSNKVTNNPQRASGETGHAQVGGVWFGVTRPVWVGFGMGGVRYAQCG